MFKITLFDAIGVSFCSGVATFFTENLDDFEKHWLNLIGDDDDLKDRYFRSKAGEIVSDYYGDDPDLNIVQFDNKCEVVATKKFVYHNKYMTLVNIFDWESLIYANEVNIELTYIKHKDAYYLIGNYKLLGVGEVDMYSKKYRVLKPHGNPVCTCKISDEFWQRVYAFNDYNEFIDQNVKRLECSDTLESKEELNKLKLSVFETENMADFIGYDVETYCKVTVGVYENKEDIDLNSMTDNDINDEMLTILMRDTLGS